MAVKTILVMDPDEDIGQFLGFILEKAGYKVTVTTSLREGIKILTDSHFDLIITESFAQTRVLAFDPAFLRELRAVAGSTPIILCSTYVDGWGPRAGDYGLSETLPKPFDIDDLLRKVGKTLGVDKSGDDDDRAREEQADSET